MDNSDKCLLTRVTLDCLLLAAVGVPLIFIYDYLPTYKRGFFCNDQSIQYPFRSNTVSGTVLMLSSMVINIIVILFCEFVHHRRLAPALEIFKEKRMPNGIRSSYYLLGTFLFGFAATQYLTILGKFTIGRLRPCFIDACKPNVDCMLPENLNKYITDFQCQNKIGAHLRQSFPSGHASLGTYAAVHLIIYLQARFPWDGLLRNVLQLVVAGLAMFAGLSRISDYRHHPMDVVAGTIIGTVVALFVTKFMVNYFDMRKKITSRETFRTDTPTVQTVEQL